LLDLFFTAVHYYFFYT